MQIIVSTHFWSPLTQNTFCVKIIDGNTKQEYRGFYEAGEWNFRIFKDDELILESRRLPLSGRKIFSGHKNYEILWEAKKLGILKKSYMRKEIIYGEYRLVIPGLFTPEIPELKLRFPLKSLIYRRTVRSICFASNRSEIMLAVAITIFVWFTWNALPAD